eukprot:431465-Amphidinium_carterae.1
MAAAGKSRALSGFTTASKEQAEESRKAFQAEVERLRSALVAERSQAEHVGPCFVSREQAKVLATTPGPAGLTDGQLVFQALAGDGQHTMRERERAPKSDTARQTGNARHLKTRTAFAFILGDSLSWFVPFSPDRPRIPCLGQAASQPCEAILCNVIEV